MSEKQKQKKLYFRAGFRSKTVSTLGEGTFYVLGGIW